MKLSSVLIIDDSPTDVFIIKQYLNRILENYEVVSKVNGLDGLTYLKHEKQQQTEQYSRFKHQLIFLDINMPKMNGFEFIDQFEKEFVNDEFFKDTIIIICSSSQNEKDLKLAKEKVRIDEFIEKPIAQDKLEELLNSKFSF